MAAATQAGFGQPGEKTFFGHPVGLYVLFFTEMWERFSFYGMRALLVLYMTKFLIEAQTSGSVYVFGFDTFKSILEFFYGELAVQPLSSVIYGTYSGFVYLTPLFGGMIADRYLGHRKTVFVGGVFFIIGHFMMAFESMFLLALFFLILGNGCFKPNISTQVGSLYPPGDQRRDSAFTIFYMGINLGAFLAPFVCGTLGEVYGWHYGFTAAGVGMCIGLAVYAWGQKYLGKDPFVPRAKGAKSNEPLTSTEWKQVGALVLICALTTVFWGVYEQQGNTLQLFATDNVDWSIGGWSMPTTWFQALNPMFIFMFVPLTNMIWSWQRSKGKEPSSVAKMALGSVILGLSFVVLIYATQGMQSDTRISFLWLVLCTWIYTMGEIYLSPVGLSLVTKVSPARIVGLMMGVWFVSSFFGGLMAGYIGIFYDKMPRSEYFMLLTFLGVAAGAAIFAFQRPLKKAIGNKI